jgi:SAM-dependent methyltransferase
MSRALYQSHSDTEQGMVDSAHRLARLQIPDNLAGASVLDIGCNEGFFCNIAAQRGATRVVGIDGDGAALAFARQRYASKGIDFRQQTWATIPDGPYDLVLWTSAMHYEHDPLTVLRRVHQVLRPGGTLILECGAVSSDIREMVPVQRHDGTPIYPTTRLLKEHLLKDFAWREASPQEFIGSDPVPRYVFHCRRKTTMLIVFRGNTGDGKSYAAQTLCASATKTVSLDLFVYRILCAKHHHTPFEKFIKANHTGADLTALYQRIDADGLTTDYAEALARTIAPSDDLVVIDGYMTDAQVSALELATRSKVKLWEATSRPPIV